MEATQILAAGDQPSVLLPALPDLIWGTVAFIIVAIAIYKFGWPTLSQNLDERSEKIEKGLQAADEARAEVADERQRLEAEINSARRDAAEIREKANDNAKEIVSDAQDKARREAAAIMDNSQKQIESDKDAAAHSLQNSVGSLATELAGRIVGEAITDKDMAQRVIDRFLDELDSSIDAEQANTSSVARGDY